MTDILSRLGGEAVMVARARSLSGESLQSTGLGSNGKIDDNLERRVSMRYCAMHAHSFSIQQMPPKGVKYPVPRLD